MSNLTVLIKPASSSCNMRCRYCFYHDVAQNRNQANMGVLSDKTMKLLINNAIAFVGSGGILNFAFQGGEPTLCGVEFFKKFTAYVREALGDDTRCQVQYALQTNGLLLDQEFCQFLAEERFLVGVSLDGPASMHNANRLDAFAKSTFRRVMDGIHRLRSHGVDYNILCVVTRLQVRHPDKLYGFFKRNGFTHVQLIPCIEDFGSKQDSLVPSPAEYGKFLCRIFELWLEEWEKGTPISIREFENLMGMVLFRQEPELCSMSGTCGVNAVVEADGSVYPCDFYVLDQWKLGNVLELGFQELLTGEHEQSFINKSKSLSEECNHCEYLNWCRGGCRRMREPLLVNTEPSQFKWCNSQKIFIPYALERMNRLGLAIRRQQQRN